MGEGHIFSKRKDHQKEDNPVDRGPHMGPTKYVIKLHMDTIIKADIFFVNTIPFFLNLTRKIVN